MGTAAAFLRKILPSNYKFWNAYAPVIKVLQESRLYRKMVREVDTALALNASDRVLDVGCGTGDWIKTHNASVASMIGLEWSSNMLARARVQLSGASNITLVQHDLNQSLPIATASVTKAACIAVHGYVQNRQQLTREVARAIAPGGLYAVATPCLGAKFMDVLKAEIRERWAEKSQLKVRDFLVRLPLGFLAAVFGVIAQLKTKTGDAHFYTQPELTTEFNEAGLEVVLSTTTYAGQYLLMVGRKVS